MTCTSLSVQDRSPPAGSPCPAPGTSASAPPLGAGIEVPGLGRLRGANTRDPVLLRWGKGVWVKNPMREATDDRERGYRASVANAQRRHESLYGLLAEVVPLAVESFEEREQRQADERVAMHVNHRNARARSWREVRVRFRSLPREKQRELAAVWNAGGWGPPDPEYLSTLIRTRAPSEDEAARDAAIRAADMARIRAEPGGSWIEHVPCGGVLRLHASGFRRLTCLECGEVFGRARAVAAAEAGELVMKHNERVYQEDLALG